MLMTEKILDDITSLFEEAKARSEFDFVLTLINYRGMGPKRTATNLYEWFDAITHYAGIYRSSQGKEKTRVGILLYSTFFENSDFYNIIGSLCRVKLGFKGSSYLFWKTRKYERFLGVGEKQALLIELLEDAGKPDIIKFFADNYVDEVRNSFFHSSYSLTDERYTLHNFDPIPGVGMSFDVKIFLFPKIDVVVAFFEAFKSAYLNGFSSYQNDKVVSGRFPDPVEATILGSKDGLKGFRIKNSVQFYGEWKDSGIMYDEKYDMWMGLNIRMPMANVEAIEIFDSLARYEAKNDIIRSDSEFTNLLDKVMERKETAEMAKATELLVKFGGVRHNKMEKEDNPHKKNGLRKQTLKYYEMSIEFGKNIFDMSKVIDSIDRLKNDIAAADAQQG